MDTLHTIPAVEWADGALVTGSDDGVLRSQHRWRQELEPLDQVRVFKASAADLSDLAVLRDFPLDPNAVSNCLAARPQLVKGQFFLTLPDQLVRLDLALMEWKTLAPPGKVSVASMEPTTGLLTASSPRQGFPRCMYPRTRATAGCTPAVPHT